MGFHKKDADVIYIRLTRDQECKYTSERIILIKPKSENPKINIIEIYSPENCKPENERTKFYEKTRREVIIIMGDFNARVGNMIVPHKMSFE